jgi:hypothetical protein
MSFLMLAAYSTGSAFSAALGMYGGSISTGSSRRSGSSSSVKRDSSVLDVF